MSCWSRQDSLAASFTMPPPAAPRGRRQPAKRLRQIRKHIGRLFLSRRSQSGCDLPATEQDAVECALTASARDADATSEPARSRSSSGSSFSLRRFLHPFSSSRKRNSENGTPSSAADRQQPIRSRKKMSAVLETASEIHTSSTTSTNSGVADLLQRRASSAGRDVKKTSIAANGGAVRLHDNFISLTPLREPSSSNTLSFPTGIVENNCNTNQIVRRHSKQPSMQKEIIDSMSGIASTASGSLASNCTVPFLAAARNQPMSKHHRCRLKAVLSPADSGDGIASELVTLQQGDFTALFLSPAFVQHLQAQEVFSDNFCAFLVASAASPATVKADDSFAFMRKLVCALEKRSEYAYYSFLYCLMLFDRIELARCIDAEAFKKLSLSIQAEPKGFGGLSESILGRLLELAMAMNNNDAESAGTNAAGVVSTRSTRPTRLDAQTSVTESFKELDERASQNSRFSLTTSGSTALSSKMINNEYFDLKTKPDFNILQKKTFFPESDTVYRMHSRPRGGALIINIVDFENHQYDSRNGSEVDGEHLDFTARLLGFKLFEDRPFINQSSQQIRRLLERFCGWKEMHAKADACFVAILTHGDRNNQLFAYDGIAIVTKEFETALANVPELVGKPKIFLFVACRGTDFDNGMLAPNLPQTSSLSSSMPPPPRRRRQLNQLPRSSLDIQAAARVYSSSNSLVVADNNGLDTSPRGSTDVAGFVSASATAMSTAPLSASSLTRNQGSMGQFWTYVRPPVEKHQQQTLYTNKLLGGSGDASERDRFGSGGSPDVVDSGKEYAGPSNALYDPDAVADAVGDPRGDQQLASSCEASSAEEEEEEEAAEVLPTEPLAIVLGGSHSRLNSSSPASHASTIITGQIAVPGSARLRVERPQFSNQQQQHTSPLRRRINTGIPAYVQQISVASVTNASSTSSSNVALQQYREINTAAELHALAEQPPPPPPPGRIPLYADQFAMYSCYTDHRSLRNVAYGTWFINMMVKVFLVYGATEDLNTMATIINQRVSQLMAKQGEKSIPQFTSTFTKKLYFNPLHYSSPDPDAGALGHAGYSGSAQPVANGVAASRSVGNGVHVRIPLLDQLKARMVPNRRP